MKWKVLNKVFTGVDKISHFFFCMAVAGVFDNVVATWMAVVISILAGAFIELIDPYIGGTRSIYDLYADIAGAVSYVPAKFGLIFIFNLF